jgi:uncharacterized Zn finger protein
MKNLYGVTPWGAWFIDVLDSYRMGERLNRGRRYANSGRVLSLELKENKQRFSTHYFTERTKLLLS